MQNRKLAVSGALILAIAGTIALTGCGPKKQAGAGHGVGQPGGRIPVKVAEVASGTIEDTFPVTGNLISLKDITLSAKAAGRIVQVNVHSGDPVRAGQTVIQQDTADLEANVRQAQANVLAAQAKVTQAQTNYQIGVTQARQGVLQAQAAVGQARENYLKAKRGLRPEEILQSQNSLLSAKANMDNALTTLSRNKTLYQQGAVAKADLDTAQTSYDVYQAQYKNAQAAYSLAQQGNRQEDIAAALDQVRQQQTALQNAIANQKQISLRSDDIAAARAGVAQAQAALAFSQQQVANASIKSPINGYVALRTADPGQIANPGTTLMRIVDLKSIYYEPLISETQLSSAHLGTPINISVDAYPGRVFAGKVTAMYPAANTSDRSFLLRVSVPNPDMALRPGMFARGSLLSRVAHDVAIVPTTALVSDASGQAFAPNTISDSPITTSTLNPPRHVVVVNDNNIVEARAVTVGIQNMEKAEITSGLHVGEKIVTVGQQSLKTGDKIAIENGDEPPSQKVSSTQP